MPEAGQDVESFVQQLRPLLAVGGLAESLEAGLGRAQPDGEDDTPAGEPVERRRLARELPGAHARQRCKQRAELDPLGPHRGGGQRDPGVDAPDGFPDEEPIPARLLRLVGAVGGSARVAEWEDKSVAHHRHSFQLLLSSFIAGQAAARNGPAAIRCRIADRSPNGPGCTRSTRLPRPRPASRSGRVPAPSPGRALARRQRSRMARSRCDSARYRLVTLGCLPGHVGPVAGPGTL